MRKKWKSRLRQGTAVLLVAAMAAEGGMPAYGYIKPKSGRQTVAGNDGTGISETEDWIETFPNGVFAFKDNAVYLKEGEKKEKKLTVYRLGGRDGEATAHIALTPAAAEMEEDGGELNTANAVSLERCEASGGGSGWYRMDRDFELCGGCKSVLHGA